MKNDVSYVFEFEMHIYEHQSTRNPNMPLRNLFYVSRLLEIELELNGDKESIYGEDKVMIPTPRFIVFYNGKKEEPEKYEYRLSDLYKNGTKDPDLELRVTVLNINMGMNEKLMEQCKTLREYSIFVAQLRRNIKVYETLDEAVINTIEYCIYNDILKEFLMRNKAEVIKMSILECSYEEGLEVVGKNNYEKGHAEGHAEGHAKGLEEGQFEMAASLYRDGDITLEKAASKLSIDTEAFLVKYEEYVAKIS